MSEETRIAIDMFFRIIIFTGFVAGPIMVLILVMYQYEKYKKWKDKDKKDAERIIVKMNEDIVKTGVSVNVLTAKETELKLSVQAYEAKLNELKEKAREVITTDNDEKEPEKSEELNIKQLQALARERKIKGFSRMKKEDLIKQLGNSAIVVQQ
jgi:hypothetical protein